MNNMISETEIVVRLSAALLVGVFFGLERELSKRGQGYAGLRTSCISCIRIRSFTLASISFDSGVVDPSRIAAGIATGVGFLGAGVIYKGTNYVKGPYNSSKHLDSFCNRHGCRIRIIFDCSLCYRPSIIILILGKFFREKVLKEDIEEDGDNFSFNS